MTVLGLTSVRYKFFLKDLCQTGVMNKFNKRAILTANTGSIRRRIIVPMRKTQFWGFTYKTLVISEINNFDADKNKNQF